MSAFTDKDIEELDEASAHVRNVLNRHPTEMTMPILSALIAATSDIDHAERYIKAVR